MVSLGYGERAATVIRIVQMVWIEGAISLEPVILHEPFSTLKVRVPSEVLPKIFDIDVEVPVAAALETCQIIKNGPTVVDSAN
ncbi:MAG: hypothetical protein RIT16_56 [Actinomycetota bacterium]